MHTRPAPTPDYRDLPDKEFASRVTELQRRYADCDLCAYDCRVDRTAGEIGACNVDDTAYVSAYFDHHGEEDVLSFVAEAISRDTFVNVMAQYRPYYTATSDDRYEEISRRITPTEYREVVAHARAAGLERIEYDPAMAGT